MRNLITETTGTGAGNWIVVQNIPRACLSISLQARTSAPMQYRWRGQTTYWTIKADTDRTLFGKFDDGDLEISAGAGVVMVLEFSTQGYEI